MTRVKCLATDLKGHLLSQLRSTLKTPNPTLPRIPDSGFMACDCKIRLWILGSNCIDAVRRINKLNITRLAAQHLRLAEDRRSTLNDSIYAQRQYYLIPHGIWCVETLERMEEAGSTKNNQQETLIFRFEAPRARSSSCQRLVPVCIPVFSEDRLISHRPS